MTSIERRTNEESPVWDLLFGLPPRPVSKDGLWQGGDPPNPMKPMNPGRGDPCVQQCVREVRAQIVSASSARGERGYIICLTSLHACCVFGALDLDLVLLDQSNLSAMLDVMLPRIHSPPPMAHMPSFALSVLTPLGDWRAVLMWSSIGSGTLALGTELEQPF